MSGFELTGALLVLGLGASGEAVARWALSRVAAGAAVSVTVVDSAGGPELERRAHALRAEGATVSLDTAVVPDADLVVASPGIPPASPLMTAARSLGVPVISEIELAYRVSCSPWVAVTGTNGKTTTTALIAHLLREAGYVAEPAGNFGPPAVRVADEMGPAGVIVAEVSSFQLALVDAFRPRVSVLLNITPDHLDYHGSMEAYAADKSRIFARQGEGDVAVIDVDDAGAAAAEVHAANPGVTVMRVSRHRRVAPGAYVDDGVLVVEDDAGVTHRFVSVADLPIRGDHNVSNALAAVAAAFAIGAEPGAITAGLLTFAPIEHRLEPAGVVDDVEYFNDSKATNPDAVFKALTAFRDRPVVLLLGGRNKGVDLGPLARHAAACCAAVVLFGEAADEFGRAFEGLDVELRRADGLDGAVAAARKLARAGDVVLLSPGCTSFDEFSAYTERGRRFKRLVTEAGEAR